MYPSIFFYSKTYYLLVIYMINYLKSFIYTASTILLSTIILTLLNYFNILKDIPLKIVMLIIPIIGIFIGSFLIGKTSTQKGYIEGLKYGIIWTLIILIINLIIKNFSITSIIYYILLILTSIIAGVLGINKKKC